MFADFESSCTVVTVSFGIWLVADCLRRYLLAAAGWRKVGSDKRRLQIQKERVQVPTTVQYTSVFTLLCHTGVLVFLSSPVQSYVTSNQYNQYGLFRVLLPSNLAKENNIVTLLCFSVVSSQRRKGKHILLSKILGHRHRSQPFSVRGSLCARLRVPTRRCRSSLSIMYDVHTACVP